MNIRVLKVLILAAFLLLGGDAFAAKDRKKDENLFPDATREEPKNRKISDRNIKRINDAYKAAEEGEDAKAQAVYDEVIGNAKSTPYEQALAWQGLSQVRYNADDIAGAIEANQKAIALDALDNASHFNLIHQIAQLNIMEENYEAALTAIDDWFRLSGSKTGETYALKGNALYRLERYPAAAEAMRTAISLSEKPNDSWNQLLIASYYDAENYAEAAKAAQEVLARDPGNRTVSRQLASIYLELEQGDKAAEVLETAKARGALKDPADLRQLYQIYNFIERPAEAVRTINEGLAAGVFKEDFDTLKGLGDSFVLTAQLIEEENATQKDAFNKAVEAYGRAAPLAKDGEMDFQRGQLLIQELEKFAEGKAAMTTAITRGNLKRPGEAYILLGNAEAELDNLKGAIAAYEKARGFPSTKSMAEQWLKSVRAR